MDTRTSWWSHIIAALSSTIVSQALAAVAQVIIIRTLSSSGYGTYTTLYAWLAIASSIIGAGFDTWLLDRGSRQPTHLRQQLGRILRIKLGLWSIVFLLFIWQVDQIAITLLSIGFIVILIESISTTVLQALRALNQHRTIAVLQLISPSLLLVTISLWPPNQIIWILTIQLIGISIVLISAWYRLIPHLPTSIHGTPVALITSWPFIISDVLAQIYTYTSTLLLASYASAADVGIFRGAWSFISYTVVIPSMIFSTTLPLLNHTNTSQRPAIIRRSAIAFGLYAIAVGVFVIGGGGQLIIWLYGESFAPSIAFIAHLSMLPLIKATTFFGVMLVIHQQRLVWRIAVQLITVSVLWLSMPPLIAQYGISGAIQSQLITETVLALGYLIGGLARTRQSHPPIWPPQRISITNMYGSRNLGDAAIHQVQLAWLTNQFPHAIIQQYYAVPTHKHTIPGLSHWVYNNQGRVAPWPTRLRRMCTLGWSICMHALGITTTWGMKPHERQAFVDITTADLVCASGGGYLYDYPSTRPWWRLISWDWWLCADMLIAIIWHRPLVLLPQSIGPLHNRPFRTFVCWLLRRAHVVYVRESYSAQLLDAWLVPYQRMPDFVWGMPAPQPLPPTITPILGINLIDWGTQSGNMDQQHAYEATLVAVATHYHTRGWHIQLFAQCTDDALGWDDTVVVQRIALNLPFATIMPSVETPAALQHQYAHLTCLLSSRLHGALLRLVMQQSAVVIAYHPKAHGIMHDIGLAAWCLPIEHITPETVIAAIDSHTSQLPIIAIHRAQLAQGITAIAIPTTNDQAT